MIEVARALGPDHRAVFLAYEPEFTHLIREAGFEVRELAPVLSPKGRAAALAFDQGRSIRQPFSAQAVRRRVEAERALIREVGARAVVMGTNLTSLISARAEGIPLVYAVPFGLTRPHVEQAQRLGFVRGANPAARLADQLTTAIARALYVRLPIAPRAFTTVAGEAGVEPTRHVADLVSADWNLLTVLEAELDGFDLPPNYRRVGPIFAKLDGELPPIVHELAAGPRPLVFLGLGSSGTRRLALAAATSLGHVNANVIAPIRHYLEPGDEAKLPDNVHAVDLVPAHKLGGLVDAAVLHGGQGTVQTACATGIPFVGMGLQSEQAWNIDVCVRAGMAISLPPGDAGGPKLADAVRRVLADADMREAAVRMREAASCEDGASVAARFVEELVAGRIADPRTDASPSVA